jgi:DNA-binding transcriptional LysR family regulator
MNVHHLELFYYVAKHEGITPAVRQMPYGIQQPAVSGQILQLEKDLGLKLFNRRPFALTPAGEELYAFIGPFFSQLPTVASRLRGEEGSHLRLAASAAVLNTHLPDVLEKLRKVYPNLRLTLREVVPTEVDALLGTQEIDVAVSLLHAKPGPGIHTRELLRLPPVLLVPVDSPIKKFADLHKKSPAIRESLITLPPHETINLLFQKELEKRAIRWQPTVEVNSLDLVVSYAVRGYGIGLFVDIPSMRLDERVRKIPLPGFPPLVIGLLFQGKLKPLAERFAREAVTYAAALAIPKK